MLRSIYNISNSLIPSDEKYYATHGENPYTIPKTIKQLYFIDYSYDRNDYYSYYDPNDDSHDYYRIHHKFDMSNLDFSYFSSDQLQSVIISPGCFEGVNTLDIDGVPNLEKLEIGDDAFNFAVEDDDYYYYDCMCNSSHFNLSNCPHLKELTLHNCSLRSYQTLNLSNLDSLQSIYIGDRCFWMCSLLLGSNEVKMENEIVDLPSLEEVSIGKQAFYYCHYVEFSSKPRPFFSDYFQLFFYIIAC